MERLKSTAELKPEWCTGRWLRTGDEGFPKCHRSQDSAWRIRGSGLKADTSISQIYFAENRTFFLRPTVPDQCSITSEHFRSVPACLPQSRMLNWRLVWLSASLRLIWCYSQPLHTITIRCICR